MRDDRPGRGDGELLAGDLEDERPEGIERGKLFHPGPRAEIRPRVDQPRERGVCLPKKFARFGMGNRGLLAGWGVHADAACPRTMTVLPSGALLLSAAKTPGASASEM